MPKFDTQKLCGDRTDRGYNQTTASGRPFWAADPRPEDVFIEDIAAQLSRICRFNGAIRDEFEIYSVAQHSCLVCNYVEDPTLKLPALLHDAPEYVLGDMIKPIKSLHKGRKVHEARVAAVIEQRFNLEPNILDHPAIKEQDYRAVLTEHRDLQVDTGMVDWGLDQAKAQPWPEKIIPVLPSEARRMFMERFNRYYHGE